MRAETHPHVERLIEVQVDRWAKLVHRLPLEANEDCDSIAALFNAHAFRFHPGEGASKAKLCILHHRALVRTPRQVDHADAVLAEHGFFGIIFEILANDQHYLAIAVSLGVGEGDIGGERKVSGHLLPQKTELIARIPDVVTGRVDGVLLRSVVITGAPGYHRAANVRLALKHADRRFEVPAWPMEICGRRHLYVRGRARLRPIRHGRRSGFATRLRTYKVRRGAQ